MLALRKDGEHASDFAACWPSVATLGLACVVSEFVHGNVRAAVEYLYLLVHQVFPLFAPCRGDAGFVAQWPQLFHFVAYLDALLQDPRFFDPSLGAPDPPPARGVPASFPKTPAT